MGRRLEAIEALGREGLLGSEREGGAIRLRFAGGEEIRSRLEAIVAAERCCCPFLDLAIFDGHADSGEVILAIGAPAEGQAVADEIAAAFAGERVAGA
jgi:hypothetical protein